MLADLVPSAPMSTTSPEKLNRMAMSLRALTECAPSVDAIDGVYVRRGEGADPAAYAFWNRMRKDLFRACIIPGGHFDPAGDEYAVRLAEVIRAGARRVTRRP
jgi:hypothetical protein